MGVVKRTPEISAYGCTKDSNFCIYVKLQKRLYMCQMCRHIQLYQSEAYSLGYMLLANETPWLRDLVFHTVTDWGDILQQWSQEILFKQSHFCLNNFELAPVRSALKPFLFTQLLFPCYPSTTAMTTCVCSPSCSRALWWSAGSCSVTLGSWREDPALSWWCAPGSGLKLSSRWEDAVDISP